MKSFIKITESQIDADFEGYYSEIEDPWLQSEPSNRLESRRILAIRWVEQLLNDKVAHSACEVGCGLGHLTGDLVGRGFQCIGSDTAKSAIDRAKMIHNNNHFYQADFNDFNFYKAHDIDLFILSEITWYILPHLDDFLDFLREEAVRRGRPIYLIHLLSVYPDGLQKYGCDYFTNLDQIMEYFGFDYLEYGSVSRRHSTNETYHGTYFIGRVMP
jgi:predicted TPR repeat methyltransferase